MRMSIPTAVLLAVVGAPAQAGAGNWNWADRPFDGTWVTEPEHTVFDPGLRAPTFSLEAGQFRREDCRLGPIAVPVDGRLHEVKDQPLFDAMSVRVIDAGSVEITQRSDGRTVWKGLYRVSADGLTATLDYEDDLAARPVTGRVRYHREGGPPRAGQHRISGTWRPERLTALSPSGLALRIATQPTAAQTAAGPDMNADFSISRSDGRSATGKINMHDYPLQGYLRGSSVAVGRLGPQTLQFNLYVDGQQVEQSRATVSEDGMTLILGQIDWICQAKTTYTLHKQVSP